MNFSFKTIKIYRSELHSGEMIYVVSVEVIRNDSYAFLLHILVKQQNRTTMKSDRIIIQAHQSYYGTKTSRLVCIEHAQLTDLKK